MIIFQSLCAVVFLQFSFHTTKAQEFRLPEALIPTHYDLQLQPILDETPGYTRFTAPGKVTITVNCTEATSTVKLHALELTIIESATLVRNAATGEAITISSVATDVDNQFFVINLGNPLVQGSQYEIYVEFITPVSQTRLDGMYLDSYVDPATNQTKYVATTLFAAISARRCYPGFDEPHLKAVFTISLARRQEYHSLSNMHQISTEPIDGMNGWYLDKFAPSLPMSTYLVAMIVSDMTFEQAPATNDADDTIVRVYAPYYFIERGGGVYAANQTKTVLAQYEEYYNSTFMLQKLDSVSLPRFFFSAMENWALITYNDRVLLYFPGETTEQERYRITNIISHEVGHHYFGNLVTCEWWTWIWLNEGFATYVSHLGVQMTYPEFNPWDRFINDVYQVAMDFDSTPDTHPVANEPSSLAEIGAVYDDIAYEKGATLLRMMQSFLTEDVVQTSIRRYLAENQFSTARQDDLFQMLQIGVDESNIQLPASVKNIMDTWTLLTGFPLIRVERISPTEVRFSQRKYEAEPGDQPSPDSWWVPISVRVVSPSPKDYFFWIPSGQNETTFGIPDTETFVINPSSDGYYRTLYSSELLENILLCAQAVKCRDSLSASSISKLLDDYLEFSKSGLDVPRASKIIGVLSSLARENLMVWQTIFKYYTFELLNAFPNYSYVPTVKLSMKQLLPSINEVLRKIDLKQNPQEKGERVILRTELLFWACFIDSSQSICRVNVEETFKAWTITDEKHQLISPFPVDLEETYLCVAASMNDSYWERIHELMEGKTLPTSKARLLSTLLCTENQTLLERILPQLQEGLLNIRNMISKWKVNVKPEHVSLFRMALRVLENENASKLLQIYEQPK